jgi:hypothetical protein
MFNKQEKAKRTVEGGETWDVGFVCFVSEQTIQRAFKPPEKGEK